MVISSPAGSSVAVSSAAEVVATDEVAATVASGVVGVSVPPHAASSRHTKHSKVNLFSMTFPPFIKVLIVDLPGFRKPGRSGITHFLPFAISELAFPARRPDHKGPGQW